jgi:hypothetical protein
MRDEDDEPHCVMSRLSKSHKNRVATGARSLTHYTKNLSPAPRAASLDGNAESKAKGSEKEDARQRRKRTAKEKLTADGAKRQR